MSCNLGFKRILFISKRAYIEYSNKIKYMCIFKVVTRVVSMINHREPLF